MDEDGFAAKRDIFEEFNSNCEQVRVPSPYLAIDNTLYSYSRNIKSKHCNRNKSPKCGLLYRSISSSTVPYTYFTLPFVDEPEKPNCFYVTGTNKYTEYLVENLHQHVDISDRNISMDRYFTNLPVAAYFLDKKVTLVGTMRLNRVGITTGIKIMKNRKDLSTKVLLQKITNFF